MYSKKVKKFTDASSNVKKKIQKFSKKDVDFIVQMVADEMQELKDAQDIYDQVDALVDAIYYIVNFSCRNAVDLDPIFNIVHKANMSKIVDGKVIKRKDGKILKPKNWQDPKPKIKQELDKQKQNLLEN